MALYSFQAKQCSRGKGQSCVNSASYISGQKLYCEYLGQSFDYTKKSGIEYTEIMLPENAPPEYSDRQTLWNAVENVEKNRKAQLAYTFIIALQNELTLEENIALAREFVATNFVARGMIADLAVHEPDPGKDGIPNPHFHVMCPIRPLNDDGTWGQKQRREYLLDENGERMRKPSGEYVFNAVPTTDWGSPETLNEWRRNWADMVNDIFVRKGLDCRIDHRSYEELGINQIPTIHEGPSVRAMEKKGIRTGKGDFNRWIKKANEMFRTLGNEIQSLIAWISVAREIIKESSVQEPILIDYIHQYTEERNAGAYSKKAVNNNHIKAAKWEAFLYNKQIFTLDDMENALKDLRSNCNAARAEVKDLEDQIATIDEKLRCAECLKETKPVFAEYQRIKSKSKKTKFYDEHEGDIKKYHAANRTLKELCEGCTTINLPSLRRERERLFELKEEKRLIYHDIKNNKEELAEIKKCVDDVIRKEKGKQKTTQKGFTIS